MLFRKIANRISGLSGSPLAFLGAFVIVVVWALSGPVFDFSDTWQLAINTFTTISTFLMVFLIQNTQNRDGKAVQLKLDELILATKGRDALVDLEDMTDAELEALDREFRDIHEKLSTSASMKKLHAKVQRAHHKRLTTREQAGAMLGHINPLHHKQPK